MTLREKIESREARLRDLTTSEEQLERNELEKIRINENITSLKDQITRLNNEISSIQIRLGINEP
jgi:predicted  nucleic acid-binding Zn-ribbon protein